MTNTDHELNIENITKAIKYPKRAVDDVLLYYTLRYFLTRLNTKYNIGTNVFDKQWDLLIILDTCRIDALNLVSSEYEFINEIDSITSLGSATPEWVASTFVSDYTDEISNTTYITANAMAKSILEDSVQNSENAHLLLRSLRRHHTVDDAALNELIYVFDHEGIGQRGPLGHEEGMTPPEYVTNNTIDHMRNNSTDRVIAHYFQPHFPWSVKGLTENRPLKKFEKNPWDYLKNKGDKTKVWKSYINELKYVLNSIETLLNNVDADRVVITADHGEAFGEFGILGHKIGSIHPQIRKVPWVETSATNNQTYTPDLLGSGTDRNTFDANQQLKALGYKL
ncbi:Arylsulfatase A or related enzyme [Halanaeroarchaeum sp. HSR-CO]|uniref:hypothetical protein n=1 Tax=Halanaeroarchaeum sp. HSR-CO TaxID=2866382 RepID=UPI00217D0E8C|nr:hypothetical protein [Halanaeroarchaeum sp. HSR-CO]UWG48128.1 Arylsulfatase A or related enzyme [Halanaeroarchaeum sp. HSR-CO]